MTIKSGPAKFMMLAMRLIYGSEHPTGSECCKVISSLALLNHAKRSVFSDKRGRTGGFRASAFDNAAKRGICLNDEHQRLIGARLSHRNGLWKDIVFPAKDCVGDGNRFAGFKLQWVTKDGCRPGGGN